jgi:hypothetical protein
MAKCMGWYGWRWSLLLMLLGFCLVAPPQSVALDLTDRLIGGLSFPNEDAESILGVGGPEPGIAAAAVAPAIAAAVSQAVTQQFPLASVAPAFTYRFNPSLNVYERSSGVPGPLFSERALTLGKGQLNFGVGYSYVDFSELNGTDLDDITTPGLVLEGFNDPTPFNPPTGLTGTFLPITLSALRTRLDIQAHVIVPAVRYGITENWDVSLAVPIINSFLRVRMEAVRVAELNGFIDFDDAGQLVVIDRSGRSTPLTNPFTQLPFVKRQSVARVKTLTRAAGSATGVGDISLRTKYHFWHTESGGAAVSLNLLLPSGEVRDFHGSDETHLTTSVFLSHVFRDRFEPHLNVGVDFNADDVDRSSFVWAAGGSFLLWRQLGFLVDFIGRSEFGRFPIHAPGSFIGENLLENRPIDSCTATQPCFIAGATTSRTFPESFNRNDLADFSFGFRYLLGTTGSVFFGGVIPLNDDGLRADFIPSGGIEYTF